MADDRSGLLAQILATQRQGVLAPPNAAQPEPQDGGGIGGALASLFGGARDPRLSAAQNVAAGRNARLQAGLTAILASQQPGATALGSIATGALTGQQAGLAGRETAFALSEQEAQKERLQELVASGAVGTDLLQQLFTQAIVSGDTNAARSIAEVLKTVSARAAGGGARKLLEIRNEAGELRQVSVDLLTGDQIDIGPAEDTQKAQIGQFAQSHSGPVMQRKINSVTVDVQQNKFTGELDPIPGPTKVVSTSAANRQASLFAAVEPMFDIVINGPQPTRFEQGAMALGLREIVRDDVQQLKIAGETIAATYVFLLSGVTARQEEVERAIRLFVPLPGDKAGALALKRDATRRLQIVLEQIRTGEHTIKPNSLEDASGVAQIIRDIGDGKIQPVGEAGATSSALSQITGRPSN